MKKLVLTLMICSFFAATSVFGQVWSGSSLNGNTYRNGNVGLEVSNPYARLEIKSAEGPLVESGTGSPLLPHFRLHTELATGGTSVWDITNRNSLNFDYGTTTGNLTRVLTLSNSSFTYSGSRLRIGTGENYYNLGVATSPANNAGHYLAFGADNTAGASAWSFTGNSTNNGGAIIQGDNKGNLFFITRATAASNTMNTTQTADNVRLFINGSGDVGIGTSTPTAKLHINDGEVLITNGRFVISDGTENQLELKSDGLIHAREIEVDLVHIPDYVFEDDYELMPLTELQKFIDLNHHLPNIKSAEEYEAYGSIPLKELNIKLLEKVEELTLYTLEQQEEIEALKKQMVEMQTLLEKINVDVKK